MHIPEKSWSKYLKHGIGIGYAGAPLQMNTASASYYFYCVNLSKENMFEVTAVN